MKSIDGGANWGMSGSDMGWGSEYINGFGIDPEIPSTLYAATDFGLFKSTNASGNWTAVTSGLLSNLDTFSSLAIDPASATLYVSGSFYVGATYSSLFKSGDSVASWTATATPSVPA